MQNEVSFKTAKRLRDAGFSQPEPAVGQFWYNSDFGLFIVGRRSFVDGRNRNIFYFETGQTFQKETWAFDSCVFAPTATDILHELESDFDLSCLQDKKWMLVRRQASDQLTPVAHWVHESPHEVAAIAWLETNEKKFVK